MFSVMITPRVGEVDGLGHINNCVLPIWFEIGRNPLFRIFDPELTFTHKTWNLIMVHTDIDFIDQLYCRANVEIKTWITRIGTKSFSMCHEAWQENRLCAKSNAIMVYYDFIKKESQPIPDDKKRLLRGHLKKGVGSR